MMVIGGELLNNTTHKPISINGVNGMLFTSNINDNKLFIPFVQGYWDRHDKYAQRLCEGVTMWSSQVHSSYNVHSDCNNNPYRFYCDSNGLTFVAFNMRTCALSIRGVFKP